MRVDGCDLPDKGTVLIRARAHSHFLTDGNEGQIAFGNIGHRPDHLMVDDPEQHIARRRAHAVDGIALHDHAILRCHPGDRNGDLPAALDLGK